MTALSKALRAHLAHERNPTADAAYYVVLIPKGTSGNCRGIGFLEVIWKLLERVPDARLSEVDLHDYLHGFWAKRGCGTGVMEGSNVRVF